MYKYRIGSRAQVMHGTAKMTGGGLTKRQLKYNKRGKIVSRKASRIAKKNNRLINAGFITRKGQFGVIRRGGMQKSIIQEVTVPEGLDVGDFFYYEYNGLRYQVIVPEGLGLDRKIHISLPHIKKNASELKILKDGLLKLINRNISGNLLNKNAKNKLQAIKNNISNREVEKDELNKLLSIHRSLIKPARKRAMAIKKQGYRQIEFWLIGSNLTTTPNKSILNHCLHTGHMAFSFTNLDINNREKKILGFGPKRTNINIFKGGVEAEITDNTNLFKELCKIPDKNIYIGKVYIKNSDFDEYKDKKVIEYPLATYGIPKSNSADENCISYPIRYLKPVIFNDELEPEPVSNYNGSISKIIDFFVLRPDTKIYRKNNRNSSN